MLKAGPFIIGAAFGAYAMYNHLFRKIVKSIINADKKEESDNEDANDKT